MPDPTNLQQQIQQNDDKSNNNYNNLAPNVKPILRRSRSERSEHMNCENFSPTSSMAGVATGKLGGKGSSILSISESVDPLKGMKKKGKASSVIGGTELREKPKHKVPQSKYLTGGHGHPLKGNSLWSDSEVGPSPSEVAAVMAEKRYPLDDDQSSVLDGWSLDESVEGLRSSGQHARKHNDSDGSDLFSCFGNICGYECQCICGKPPKKRSINNRFRHSPSIGTPG
ncbi:hypothetical protein BUALT_Bualt16G0000300 [Buddleja alternifolia]|uniref:Uncharacterized protein n=1 Tax=Buddleja alternifolia TaxID=168488 RepID=A0AAV6WH19_9LAMI|nr:hypothetical protein BUALT_Bualt16G0000300 [Buddleja alternifolia]